MTPDISRDVSLNISRRDNLHLQGWPPTILIWSNLNLPPLQQTESNWSPLRFPKGQILFLHRGFPHWEWSRWSSVRGQDHSLSILKSSKRKPARTHQLWRHFTDHLLAKDCQRLPTIGDNWQQFATIGNNWRQLTPNPLYFILQIPVNLGISVFLLENVKISAHLDYFAGKTRILPQLPSFPTSLSSTPVDF